MNWREYLLPNAIEHSPLDPSRYAAYQFGVFSGNSMRAISSIMARLNRRTALFYGFDVFTGMPKEHAEETFQSSWNPDIEPDAFNAVKRFGFESVDSYVESIVKVMENDGFGVPVQIMAGLVEDTLPAIKDPLPAFYVDFDMDIYSPTKFAFDYMMKNDLIGPGTLIGYDDWGGTPDFDNFTYGESRAHKEICEEYNVSMVEIGRIGDAYPSVSNLWMVRSVG